MGTAFLTMRGEEGEILFPLDHPVTVGSSGECEVRVKTAAPRHAQVSRTSEGYVLRDLTGQGLVRVNGAVTARQSLRNGDVVKIGTEEFKFTRDDTVTLVIETPEPAPRSRRAPRHSPSTTQITQVQAPSPPGKRNQLLHWAAPAIVIVIVVGIVISVSRKEPPKTASSTLFPISRKSASSTTREASEAQPSLEVEKSSRAFAPPAARESAKEHPPAPLAPIKETPFVAVTPALPGSAPAFSIPELVSLLNDSARRSSTPERARMAEAIRGSRHEAQVIPALGIVLTLPESQWPRTPTARHAWLAYLRDCPLEKLDRLTAEDHVAYAKRLLEAGGTPALKLVALAHLLDAGQGEPHGFRQSSDGKIWGDGDALLHYRLSRSAGDEVSVDNLTASSSFGVRYASTILQIRRTMERGTGFEATYNDIPTHAGSVAPPSAAAHLKALKLSFRNAVRCRECKEGRIRCTGCEGKTRVDLPCPLCQGSGRTLAPGAVDGARVTQKCRNCDGRKVFKDVGCPTCSRSGNLPCTSCAGRPWREVGCGNVACRAGWTPCATCGRKGRVDAPCPDCNGTGRVAAPGAVDGARVTQKCRTCNENHGVFRLGAKCSDCDGTGLVRCDTCKGKPGEVKVSIPLAEVFSTEPCRDCSGSGWPWAPLPVPCRACAGLGSLVKPAADPTKLLASGE